MRGEERGEKIDNTIRKFFGVEAIAYTRRSPRINSFTVSKAFALRLFFSPFFLLLSFFLSFFLLPPLLYFYDAFKAVVERIRERYKAFSLIPRPAIGI